MRTNRSYASSPKSRHSIRALNRRAVANNHSHLRPTQTRSIGRRIRADSRAKSRLIISLFRAHVSSKLSTEITRFSIRYCSDNSKSSSNSNTICGKYRIFISFYLFHILIQVDFSNLLEEISTLIEHKSKQIQENAKKMAFLAELG